MPLSVSKDSSPVRTLPSAINTKEKSPAFHGASRAFIANATASAIASNGADGALAAAAFLGGGGRGQMQTSHSEGLSPLSRQTTGQSTRSRDPSPSYVAANLAASQAFNRPSYSQGPSLSHRQGWRRPSPLQEMPTAFPVTDGQSEDWPSPDTKSLVQLYESKPGPPIQKTQSIRYVSRPGPPIRSPKPVRPLVRSESSTSVIAKNIKAPLVKITPHASLDEPNASRHDAAAAATELAGPVHETAIGTQGASPTRRESPQALPTWRKDQMFGGGGNDRIDSKPKRARSSAAPLDGGVQSSPDNISKEPKAMSRVYSKSQPSSSSDSMVLQTPKRLQYPAMAPNQHTKSFDIAPPQPMQRQISRDHTRQLSTHMSVDSLANAMVASSLASSRAPSPTKSIPMPPPPRRHHLFHRSHSQELISRTPSPAKTMRHTMRKPPESDNEMDGHKKGKSHLVRKHQHKHHEGDRKRYRTQVTERERKRYEGVWAANKGLPFSPASDPGSSANEVLNIVVKDIWRRSRLPDDVLEEVWDLAVGSQDTDRLGREEFVVGLWLIDQRLKGNKLPIKVSESVWASVRRLPGIKVPRNRH